MYDDDNENFSVGEKIATAVVVLAVIVVILHLTGLSGVLYQALGIA